MNADEKFREFFDRQEDIILCNARAVRLLIRNDVIAADGTWIRAAVETRLKATESEWTDTLERREGGFPADTCRKLQERRI